MSDKIGSDINKCHFYILYNEVAQHSKDLFNSMNRYEPKAAAKKMNWQGTDWEKDLQIIYLIKKGYENI